MLELIIIRNTWYFNRNDLFYTDYNASKFFNILFPFSRRINALIAMLSMSKKNAKFDRRDRFSEIMLEELFAHERRK